MGSAATDSVSDPTEDVCRICHDNPSRLVLISPCLCKGSMGKVHRTCLERWLAESGKLNCEICGHVFETIRRPKYTGIQSLVAWIRQPLAATDTRNLFFDLACFFILTPLAAISAWLCVVGAKHYSSEHSAANRGYEAELIRKPLDSAIMREKSFETIERLRRAKTMETSNATWTSIGLLTLTGTLLAAYYVWLFVAVRYHIQVWKEWRARNFIVTISPLNAQRLEASRATQSESCSSSARTTKAEVPAKPIELVKVHGREASPVPSRSEGWVQASRSDLAKPKPVVHEEISPHHSGFLVPTKIQDVNHVVIPIVELKKPDGSDNDGMHRGNVINRNSNANYDKPDEIDSHRKHEV